MNIVWKNFEEIPSTSLWVKENISTLAKDKITVVQAEKQTAGYGQRGRKWDSGKGDNLALTLSIPLDSIPKHLGGVTLVFALSCCQVLEKKGVTLNIKWPNDLILEGGKVGGILGETIISSKYLFLILGFGFNVGMKKESLENIDQAANSLVAHTGKEWEKENIAKKILNNFSKKLPLFLSSGFSPFKNLVEEKLLWKGKDIAFDQASKITHGKLFGITHEGHLILKTNGKEKCFVSGRIQKP